MQVRCVGRRPRMQADGAGMSALDQVKVGGVADPEFRQRFAIWIPAEQVQVAEPGHLFPASAAPGRNDSTGHAGDNPPPEFHRWL